MPASIGSIYIGESRRSQAGKGFQMKSSGFMLVWVCCLIVSACSQQPVHAEFICYCCLADINEDCSIDHDDLGVMTKQWLAKTALSITDGLVSYWSFDDGTAVDNCGTGNDGAIYGATPTVGVSEHGLSFDGYNDCVTVPDDDSLDIVGSISLVAWVKPISDNPSKQHYIIDKRVSTENGYYLMYRTKQSPKGFLFRYNNTTLLSVTDPELNSWYHVVGTFDSTTSILKIYVNGVLENSTVRYDIVPGSNAAALTIGKRHTNAYYFNGLIDEIRIYARDLSEEEVRYLYHVSDGESRLLADLSQNDAVDFGDFALLGSCWLSENPNCNMWISYLGGDVDDFQGTNPNDEITLQPKWTGFFAHPPIDFDTFTAGCPLVYTFSELSALPGYIGTAQLRVRVQAGSDSAGPLDDRVFLACLTNPDPGQPLEDQATWWRPFGVNNGHPDDDGLLTMEWQEGANHTFTFDLANLPTSDGGSEDLILLLNSRPRVQRCVDVIVSDDTAVDYMELAVTTTPTPMP